MLAGMDLRNEWRALHQRRTGRNREMTRRLPAHLRRMTRAHGPKIDEYAVFREQERIAGETEESVSASIGLRWAPPELREDQGEIDASRENRLPSLVEREHLRGDLHAHTNASSSAGSIWSSEPFTDTSGCRAPPGLSVCRAQWTIDASRAAAKTV